MGHHAFLVFIILILKSAYILGFHQGRKLPLNNGLIELYYSSLCQNLFQQLAQGASQVPQFTSPP